MSQSKLTVLPQFSLSPFCHWRVGYGPEPPDSVFKYHFNKLGVSNQRVLKAEEKSIMKLSLNNDVKT